MSVRPLRVLLTADAVGGVWQYATDLARGLATHDVEAVLAILGPRLDGEQRSLARSLPNTTLIETDLPLDWLAEDAATLRHAGEALAGLAEAHAVDLVHLNQPALAAEAAFAMPLLAMSHSCLATWWTAVEDGEPPADFAWRAALHGQGLRRATRTLCPTHAFAEATSAAYRLPSRPEVIHNGRAPSFATAPLADYAFTAGRLWDRGKDVATLDRAAARLTAPIRAAGGLRGPHGDGASFGHIDLLGHVPEGALMHLLAARPVFASAARYEPFGLAVLEAAAAGCALVLADIPTFRELWEDAAVFVAPGDDAGFAAAIEHVLASPDLRDQLGERARQAVGRYTPARTAEATAALYAELLATCLPERVAA